MKDLCNLPENFTREIRHVLIYDADSLSFNDNYNGIYPEPSSYLHRIDINTSGAYKRKVQLKRYQKKNDYFDIDIKVPFYDLSFDNRDTLYKLDADKRYLIITVSNKEMLVIGNDRERLSINIIDSIMDNSGGKDHFIIQIKGKTTIIPRLRSVEPAFRVLFFTPRLK